MGGGGSNALFKKPTSTAWNKRCLVMQIVQVFIVQVFIVRQNAISIEFLYLKQLIPIVKVT